MSKIAPFTDLTLHQREAAAQLLLAVFGHYPAGYNTIEDARAQVGTFFTDPDRAAWACVEDDAIVGWIGRIRLYDGHVWELHPLLVRAELRRRGLGRLLVEKLETAAREAGVITITLGADDELGGTNIFGVDVYPDIAAHISVLAQTGEHPLNFYRALGYAVYGLLPDANGPGLHDILMSKRLR